MKLTRIAALVGSMSLASCSCEHPRLSDTPKDWDSGEEWSLGTDAGPVSDAGAPPADAGACPSSALRILTPYLPAGVVGSAYAQQIEATCGAPPYAWQLTGPLDTLVFTPSGTSASLAGTPSISGYYDLFVTVTDNAGAQDAFRYQLLVTDPPPGDGGLYVSTPSRLPEGHSGESYAVPMELRGGNLTPVEVVQSYWAPQDPLPPGLMLTPTSAGLLEETPTQAGSYDFTLDDFQGDGTLLAQKAMHLDVLPARKIFPVSGFTTLESGHGFVAGPSMTELRLGLSVTPLASGSVLVAGGGVVVGSSVTTEILDAQSGFKPGPPMILARANHTATLLQDGRVLLVGGGITGVPPGAELYDPKANAFAAVSGSFDSRIYHVAARLPSGDVFIAGGQGASETPFGPTPTALLTSTAIYQVASDAFVAGPNLAVQRIYATATALPDGRVAIIGGQSSSSDDSLVELYDPASGTLEMGGFLRNARMDHDAALLDDGKVLVTGGFQTQKMIDSAEIYDPATKTSREVGPMFSARRAHHSVRLPDGRFLLFGGAIANPTNMVPPAYEGAEIFDPRTEKFTPVHGVFNRWDAFPVLLPNGVVAAIGGYTNPWGGDDSRGVITELYVP